MRSGKRTAAVFLMLAALVIVFAVLNICLGSVRIPVSDIAGALTGKADPRTEGIVRTIRLPRTCMALLLGGALAVSGFLLQTYFRNPIAGPFILGISSGAKLAVACVLIGMAGTAHMTTNAVLILAAFGGALAATGLIILISRRISSMAALLASGVMIGYLTNAATDFLITFADDADIVNLHGWSQGSFSGMDSQGAAIAFWVILTALILTMLLSKPLAAFRLGETYAFSVGVNVRYCRVALILLSSVLSATVTAFAGPVSFVGIAVPFLMRELLRSSRPSILIPACFLGGAVFCLGADLIARMAFSPLEMNISSVTSVFGAPIVIGMLIGRRKEQ